ncbi:hypothetical protein [Archaeoglobus veneficus]|uniref:Uncharacterized protein n=1 Tax=Archaeoglobus veneficus (strain DSM 11195 / SNP6) TaxID=693661 RepID=F2KR62_ARCVS|nr:hypothetical protein [Archaeoglobus veneficus]AEA46699.1 hypothetical protein Arcve_0679 [Archaeoglobus veneficus SNP6]
MADVEYTAWLYCPKGEESKVIELIEQFGRSYKQNDNYHSKVTEFQVTVDDDVYNLMVAQIVARRLPIGITRQRRDLIGDLLRYIVQGEVNATIVGADIQVPVQIQSQLIDLLRKSDLQFDPDGGKLLVGRFSYIKLMAQNLEFAVDEPLSLNDILIYPEPAMADVNGADYEEGTVEALAGASASSSISKTFTSILTNTIRVAGVIQVGVSVYLELRQVDATYPGTASIDSITVELYEYDGVTANLIGSKTKTVSKSISGTAAANTTFSELFNFKIPISSPKTFNESNFLQLKVTVNFSATTDASATTTTIAAARINFARGSDETFVMLPVV